jgi:hypothetical protein
VTLKSAAGTNVASNELSNLSSGDVTGGALTILGEDYGEGSSIVQERSHAVAMKSQLEERDVLGFETDAGRGGAMDRPMSFLLLPRTCRSSPRIPGSRHAAGLNMGSGGGSVGIGMGPGGSSIGTGSSGSGTTGGSPGGTGGSDSASKGKEYYDRNGRTASCAVRPARSSSRLVDSNAWLIASR